MLVRSTAEPDCSADECREHHDVQQAEAQSHVFHERVARVGAVEHDAPGVRELGRDGQHHHRGRQHGTGKSEPAMPLRRACGDQQRLSGIEKHPHTEDDAVQDQQRRKMRQLE